MILFASAEFEAAGSALKRHLPQIRTGQYKARRFDNRELRIDVETPVNGEHCLVLGSIAPPDARLTSTLLLAHTLRKEGAIQVTGLFPYLAYSRQDKDKPGESLAAAWIGESMRASGLDRVITVDVHSTEDQRLFPIPLSSISPAGIFAGALEKYGFAEPTLIAPDEGAIGRCAAIRAAAGLPDKLIPYFEKHRAETGVVHGRFVGEVGAKVVLIDDILDTGATLVSACQRLLCDGVEDIQIMVTHGLFTANAWQSLWESGVSRIFCTDTVPLPAGVDEDRIVRLSVIPLLAEAIVGSAEVFGLAGSGPT